MADQEAYQQQLDAVKGDLRALRSDMKGLSDVFKSNSRNALRDAGERFAQATRERMEHLRGMAQDYMERTREYGKKTLNRTAQYIEHRPISSVLIALGAGLLIGRLLKRR
jgi:ElaB/YqjD/DUF883 family membrane-anchored ribosome-binding protein